MTSSRQDTELYRVRGVEGVEWAMPLYKGLIKARLEDGTFQTCMVVGLDDATLIGGPSVMVAGLVADLRQSDAVIVDLAGASGKAAKPASVPDGKPDPLHIDDALELDDHRAIVVGLAQATPTFHRSP